MKVVINLRPLWDRYFLASHNKSQVDRIQTNCMKNIAKLITESDHIDFTFVPFNTDNFGMSDIDAALSLEKMLISKNFQIKYEEMSFIDMRNYFSVRQFDKAICMRLHACVFSHYFGVPTFGIEYADYPGKVAQFCQEHGIRCFQNILDADYKVLSEWLNEDRPCT